METKQKRTKVKVSVLALAVLVLLTLSGPAWADMISYWKFDKGSGNIAGDCVNGNHGTIYGATWTTGIVNGALSFDGSDDYVAVDIASIKTHTLEAWIYRKDGSTGGIIGFEKGSPSAQFNYTIGVDKNGNNKLFYYVWSGSHPVHFLYSSSVIPINDWVHIAVTRDDSTGISKMYINGQYETTMTCGGTSATYFSIGMTSWYEAGYHHSYFNGFIDEAAIYNRALTGSEIWDSYVRYGSVKAVNLLHSLAQKVIALNLQKGIEDSLGAKLNAALKAIDDINENNDVVAINTLQAFIKAVEAQRGKKISEEDAEALIASAQQIIDMLESG